MPIYYTRKMIQVIQDLHFYACGIYSATLGRMAIAWGADARFATIKYMASFEKTVDEGVEMYLNRPEEWEARN